MAYSATRQRTLDVALDLFAVHGVTGTSLQMIADALGVTKAAIYHQFRTKEAIVLAVAEHELEKLEGWVSEAEASGDRELLLERLIDLAILRRGAVSTLQVDPGMVQFLGSHQPFQELMIRMFSVLLAGETGASAQVSAAMLSAVIGGTVAHPFVAGLDESTLKAELLQLSKRLIL